MIADVAPGKTAEPAPTILMSFGMFPSGDSPVIIRWIALFVAIAALLVCGGVLVSAAEAQITGTATYRYGPRDLLSEQVEAKTEPKKYHDALQKLYFQAGAAGLIGYVAFVFFRKLGE